MILFLSKYPQTDADFRDGFFQRVASIDEFYLKDERIYLNTSLFGNKKKEVIKTALRTEISCNFFLHFLTIYKIFRRSELIYIQSIYNAFYNIFFIIFFSKNYILDLHGVVPEELEMKNKTVHALIASKIEGILFKKIRVCISVTNKMAIHYQSKYPNSQCKYIVYAILPTHLKGGNLSNESLDKSDKIEIIYSGNTQVWQNVDLMLQAIKSNSSKQVNYTILTGEPEKIYEKLNDFKIEDSAVTVKSVKPNELAEYYKKSHYGFILRDDILVNRVACPTKIIEYLAYGIKPIILSEKIGDFEDYGYEYIFLEQLNDGLSKQKSIKNIQIIKEILLNNQFNLKSKILNNLK